MATQGQFDEIKLSLEETRRRLLKRLSAISHDRLHEDGPIEADFAEQAQQVENDEVLDRLDESGRQELQQVEIALQRMEAGVYGICVSCEDEIPIERLQALPYALKCIECARAAS